MRVCILTENSLRTDQYLYVCLLACLNRSVRNTYILKLHKYVITQIQNVGNAQSRSSCAVLYWIGGVGCSQLKSNSRTNNSQNIPLAHTHAHAFCFYLEFFVALPTAILLLLMSFRFDFAWLKYPIRKWNWIELKCFFWLFVVGNRHWVVCSSLSLLVFVTYTHVWYHVVENKQIAFTSCCHYCLFVVAEWMVIEWEMEKKNYIFHEFVSVKLLSIIIRLNYVWKVFLGRPFLFHLSNSNNNNKWDCYFGSAIIHIVRNSNQSHAFSFATFCFFFAFSRCS